MNLNLNSKLFPVLILFVLLVLFSGCTNVMNLVNGGIDPALEKANETFEGEISYRLMNAFEKADKCSVDQYKFSSLAFSAAGLKMLDDDAKIQQVIDYVNSCEYEISYEVNKKSKNLSTINYFFTSSNSKRCLAFTVFKEIFAGGLKSNMDYLSIEVDSKSDVAPVIQKGAVSEKLKDKVSPYMQFLGTLGNCEVALLLDALVDDESLAKLMPVAGGDDSAAVCGNGIVEPGEECDDGNDDDSDACLSTCKRNIGSENELCGNFVVDEGEMCDNGPDEEPEVWDNCLFCQVYEYTQPMCMCGNGIVENWLDEFANFCSREDVDWSEWLGEGYYYHFPEECDPMAPESIPDGQACTDECDLRDIVCGDGILDEGEECDDGSDNSDTIADACRTDCLLPVCGDNVTDSGEECDGVIGVPASFACTDECELLSIEACGNGILEGEEECDDGDEEDGDGCSSICEIEPVCGNGVLDDGEECDDGDLIDGDGCDSSCVIEIIDMCDITQLDVILVIDRSGSMAGERLIDAKAAAIEFVNSLDPENDRVGIVSFETDAHLDQELTFNYELARNAVNSLSSEGSTNMADGVFSAQNEIVRNGRPEVLPVIILLSDGEPTGGTAGPLSRATAAKEAGTRIFTIGLGFAPGSSGETLLTEMATNENHYYRAPRSTDLRRIYLEISGAMCGCGNGIIEAPEECDDGSDNSDTLPDACRTTCYLPDCGDGAVDSGEECDPSDLNSIPSGYSCNAECDLNLMYPDCTNGVLDSGYPMYETDIDCGGSRCSPCESEQNCGTNRDCVSDICIDGNCVSCSDGVRNAFETDIDCGGHMCDVCDLGQDCSWTPDCVSGLVCQSGVCETFVGVSNCDDGLMYGAETDVDCGGLDCDPCAMGMHCDVNSDCVVVEDSIGCVIDSNTSIGTCTLAPSCTNGFLDPGRPYRESDIDCGRGSCDRCEVGRQCNTFRDCETGIGCVGGICTDHCSDGVISGSVGYNHESDIDCGGYVCSACEIGQTCNRDGDCASYRCTAGLCS